MPFSLRFGVHLMYLTILLVLPEQGRLQCYRPMSEAPGFVIPPCCTRASKAHIEEPTVSCYEQRETTFTHCQIHAFILTSVNRTHHCVDPTAKWLKRRFEKLQKRGICCHTH